MRNPRDEAGAADALDRYWETLLEQADDAPGRVARNETEPEPGLEPEPDLAATVRRFRRLPDAPGPEAAFVARLEERLMDSGIEAGVVARSVDRSAAGTGGAPRGWSMPAAPVPTPRPRRRAGWWVRGLNGLAAAALTVAIVAGLAAGWGWLPGGGQRAAAPPTLAEATPGAAVVPGAAMWRGNAGRTGEVAGPGPVAQPDRLWTASFVLGEESYVSGALLVADGAAYLAEVLDTGAGLSAPAVGRVLALDAATGAERWRTTILAPRVDADGRRDGSSLHLAAIADGTAYVVATAFVIPSTTTTELGPETGEPLAEASTASSELVALDAATGTERWRFPLGGHGGEPAVEDGVVYLSVGGDVLALDATSGAEVWRTSVAGGASAADGEDWLNSVAVADGRVFAADGVGVLHALDAGTGIEQWRWQVAPEEDGYFGIPVSADGTVFVHATTYDDEGNLIGNRLQALDAATGAERWLRADDRYIGEPVVGNGLVIHAGDRGEDQRITALDADSGRERWSVENDGFVDGSLVLSRGVLYVSTYDPGFIDLGPITDFLGLGGSRVIQALDAESGERLWQVGVGGDSGLLSVGEERIYLLGGDRTGDDGTLIAYGSQ